MLPGNPEAGASFHPATYTPDEWQLHSFGDDLSQVQGGLHSFQTDFNPNTFQEYANSALKRVRDEWGKIHGRFVDISINLTSSEQIELIASALSAKNASVNLNLSITKCLYN